jgi:putative DNA primase/helicase
MAKPSAAQVARIKKMQAAKAAQNGHKPRPGAIVKPDGDESPYADEAVRDPAEVMPNARRFMDDLYAHDAHLRLVYKIGSFYRWDASAYAELSDDELRAQLYLYFEHAWYWKRKGDEGSYAQSFQPNSTKVSALVDALRAVAMPDEDGDAPLWLVTPPRGVSPGDQCIACVNGILHVETRRLLPATPGYFNLDARPFAYDDDAPVPKLWLRFLAQIFPDDQEAIDGLQEWFGYVLSGDTSKQKMALLVGPPRSGKGTIARVLRALVGRRNSAAPTMRMLNGNFGAQPLIGKSLATIPDARIEKINAGAKELLLAISGEDDITIDRKNREQITLRLGTRIMLLSNELPTFTDASAAIASRFIIWEFTQSFLGKEDDTLAAKLLSELPGIFNWALEGLDRLNVRGAFTQHMSGRDAARELGDLASAINVFLRDRMVVVEAGSERTLTYPADPDGVFEEWRRWCERNNFQSGSSIKFWRDLRAAVPGLDRVRPWAKPGLKGGTVARPRVYNRIGYKHKPYQIVRPK